MAEPEDGVALFAEFTRLADELRMHPDERCDILGVSVPTWRAIVRGRASRDVLCSRRVMRRVGYAIGLMRRMLANRPPPPAAPRGP